MPPSGPLILIVTGYLLIRSRYRKTGKMMILTGFSVIYLLSTGLVANILIRPLEDRYPPLKDKVKADAIVVLTAGVRDLSHIGIGFFPDTQSLERLVEGYRIHTQLKDFPVIISGGRADPTKPEISIGGTLGKTALALGMPEKDLVIEDDSINTYEGALRVRDILKGRGKRVILVTSASHMPRSVKLYRAAGFDVVPAPTDFLGGPLSLNMYSFIPTSGNLWTSSIALYEYLSTLWYVTRGTF